MNIIISYINPDLDGIACALALSHMHAQWWSPGMSGELDNESKVVLETLGLEPPQVIANWQGVERIWLVDTHHVKQLDKRLPVEKVVLVTDHHPNGDVNVFNQADIQNELVGAAATLVAEHAQEKSYALTPTFAQLLQAAILSNTLDFKAPATHERDQEAYAWLETIAPLSNELKQAMQQAREAILQQPTFDIVASDTKVFDFNGERMLIGQVEAPNALKLLERPDLTEALQEACMQEDCTQGLLNIVDTHLSQSALLATHDTITSHFAKALKQEIDVTQMLIINRVIQRKTDILPHLNP